MSSIAKAFVTSKGLKINGISFQLQEKAHQILNLLFLDTKASVLAPSSTLILPQNKTLKQLHILCLLLMLVHFGQLLFNTDTEHKISYSSEQPVLKFSQVKSQVQYKL